MTRHPRLPLMLSLPTMVLITLSMLALFVKIGNAQSLGSIIENTNLALPSSYEFKEYVFPEPQLTGNCDGETNSTIQIDSVFVSQTHRLETNSEFMFIASQRPFLLQLAVSGSGGSPDITVEGFSSPDASSSLGVLCMQPPTQLPTVPTTSVANFKDYYSVTIPKAWVNIGLSLKVKSGDLERTLSAAQLKLLPYTEVNLVMVNMDVLDYNDRPHDRPIFSNFLQEFAAEIPASTIRFGVFPETIRFPEIVVSNNTEQLVRLRSTDDIDRFEVPDEGNINAVANTFLENMQTSADDYLSTIYFGNTLNLAPGGWGGNRSFVSPDFTDIFIHEFGHSLSLLHWGGVWNIPPQDEFAYLYPYGGEINAEGGGGGRSWRFNQDIYEFENFICEEPGHPSFGLERSDAMQREVSCRGKRTNGLSPWDGFGDFSAYAMTQYLIGGNRKSGSVQYRGESKAYQIPEWEGFPTLSLQNGSRAYSRFAQQPQNQGIDLDNTLPGENKRETDVYMIYGSMHSTQSQANIVYKPIKYNGTLLPNVDPTDPATFATLKTLIDRDDFPALLYRPRDITVRMTYQDGTVHHALVPFTSYERDMGDDFGAFRRDVSHFSVVVSAEKVLCKVDVFRRPFVIQPAEEDIAGNINHLPFGITAQNFMNDAQLTSSYNCQGRASDDSAFFVIPTKTGKAVIFDLGE